MLRRIERGDEDAFTVLYERHQPAIFRYALRMTGSRPAADDVVQDVFLALIRGSGNYDPSAGELRSYLYGIARRLICRQGAAEDQELSGEETAAEGDPLHGLLQEETVERVRQALLAIPEHYREVVVLCEMEEMDYARAAEILDCAVGTVRSRLHRAKCLLAERLSGARVRI